MTFVRIFHLFEKNDHRNQYQILCEINYYFLPPAAGGLLPPRPPAFLCLRRLGGAAPPTPFLSLPPAAGVAAAPQTPCLSLSRLGPTSTLFNKYLCSVIFLH